MKKPSDFNKYPFDCSGVAHNKCEYETAALNIMVVLSRTGNTFRDLTLEEYCETILEVDNRKVGFDEAQYFNDTIWRINTFEKAQEFSKNW